MGALLFDPSSPEDASGTPHEVTHAPEALRYAVMSRGRNISCTVSHLAGSGIIGF